MGVWRLAFRELRAPDRVLLAPLLPFPGRDGVFIAESGPKPLAEVIRASGGGRETRNAKREMLSPTPISWVCMG
jgi:hypothetical protein